MNETVLLRNQIAALTKESDEWMRSLEFSLKQRDKLNAERDAAREAVISNCARVMTVTTERDALKDAARLALDVMDDLSGVGMSEVECLSVLRAIAALKAAL